MNRSVDAVTWMLLENVKMIVFHKSSSSSRLRTNVFRMMNIRLFCSVEQWREIPGYPNYHVSNLGNVKNIRFNKIRTINRQQTRPQLSLCRNSKEQFFYLSRLVLMAFRPVELSRNLQANHKDGNPRNNALSNLEWVTPQENIIHSYRAGVPMGRRTPVILKNERTQESFYYDTREDCHAFLRKNFALDVSRQRLTTLIQQKKVIGEYRLMYADESKYILQVADEEGEEWRLCHIGDRGWKYFVSSVGRVKVVYHSGKEMLRKSYRAPNGYLRIKVAGKLQTVHRLVAKHFIDNPYNHPCVDHIDTDPLNNSASNLRWVTRKQNMNNPLTKAKRQARVTHQLR